VTRLALCALGLILVLMAGCGDEATPERAPAPSTITEADSGRSFALARGASASLRLSGTYAWSEPAVRGDAVRLDRVDYFQDPGFSEWTVVAERAGTATITARGTPAGGAPLRFDVEITVP
jgi:hypothetical protein